MWIRLSWFITFILFFVGVIFFGVMGVPAKQFLSSRPIDITKP